MQVQVRCVDFAGAYSVLVFAVQGDAVHLVYGSTFNAPDLRDSYAHDVQQMIAEGKYTVLSEYTPEQGTRYWFARVCRVGDTWRLEKMTPNGRSTKHVLTVRLPE